MVFGIIIVNPFSWKTNVISSKNSCLITMPFLLTHNDVRTRLLNRDWSIQVSCVPAVCKVIVTCTYPIIYRLVPSHSQYEMQQCLQQRPNPKAHVSHDIPLTEILHSASSVLHSTFCVLRSAFDVQHLAFCRKSGPHLGLIWLVS